MNVTMKLIRLCRYKKLFINYFQNIKALKEDRQEQVNELVEEIKNIKICSSE